jgi:transglutaminase-like putative cysteine protease
VIRGQRESRSADQVEARELGRDASRRRRERRGFTDRYAAAMRRATRRLSILILFLAGAAVERVEAQTPGPTPEARIALEHGRRVRCRLRTTTRVLEGERGIDAFEVVAAVPPDCGFQRIESVRVLPEDAKCVVGGVPGRRWMRAVVGQAGESARSRQVEVVYDAELRSRRLITDGSAPLDDVDAVASEIWTAASVVYDYHASAFRRWRVRLDLTRRPEETTTRYARRAFLALCDTFQYREARLRRRDPTASEVCMSDGGDCGELTTVFVAALRAEKIAARRVVGRWADSERESATLETERRRMHVKAEFYVPTVGWIPADPSLGAGKGAGAAAHFGDDPGDFIAFHFDAEVPVERFSGVFEATCLQAPPWRAFGDYNRRSLYFEEDWLVDAAADPGSETALSGKPVEEMTAAPVVETRETRETREATSDEPVEATDPVEAADESAGGKSDPLARKEMLVYLSLIAVGCVVLRSKRASSRGRGSPT